MTCRCVPPVDITLYRASASGEGRQIVSHLELKGVCLEDIDVSADPDALLRMRALSGQDERPVIVIDGDVFVGYDPDVLDRSVPSRF